MTLTRTLPFAALLLLACGPSTPEPDATPDTTAVPTAQVEPTAKPEPTTAPTAPPDTGSFAAAPTIELNGSTVKLTYEGGTYTLSDSGLIPAGKGWDLRFQEPAAEGAHQIKLKLADVKAGEPAKVDGKGTLFFQLYDGKNTDGSFKLVDISSKCNATGTVTVAEIPKPGGKAKGSIDVTITCDGVEKIKAPLPLKGDFSGVPLAKK
jgi:hypothetical protein